MRDFDAIMCVSFAHRVWFFDHFSFRIAENGSI